MRKARIALMACVMAISMGCVGGGWKADSMYTETSTYDGGQNLYQEVGVSGALGKSDVRMDLFGTTYLNTHGNSHEWGGGVRFAFPIR